MRPHNWQKFSFGPWLEQASQRMHKNKLAAALANKLARIAWSVLRHGNRFDTNCIEVTAREPIKQAGYISATSDILHKLSLANRSRSIHVCQLRKCR